MFLMQTPIETTDYMLFGFSVIFGSMGLYLVSLFVRARNLRRDVETLESLEEEEE
jgi:hypothetical protein